MQFCLAGSFVNYINTLKFIKMSNGHTYAHWSGDQPLICQNPTSKVLAAMERCQSHTTISVMVCRHGPARFDRQNPVRLAI